MHGQQVSQSINSTGSSNGHCYKPDVVQQSSTVGEICHPLVDQVKAWSDIAEAQYGEEGGMAGWNSDDSGPESSESQYLKVSIARCRTILCMLTYTGDIPPRSAKHKLTLHVFAQWSNQQACQKPDRTANHENLDSQCLKIQCLYSFGLLRLGAGNSIVKLCLLQPLTSDIIADRWRRAPCLADEAHTVVLIAGLQPCIMSAGKLSSPASELTKQQRPNYSDACALQANLDVPVVENLEDIWLVGKLQKERQASRQAQERQKQLQHYKQVSCSFLHHAHHWLVHHLASSSFG